MKLPAIEKALVNVSQKTPAGGRSVKRVDVHENFAEFGDDADTDGVGGIAGNRRERKQRREDATSFQQ